MSHLAPHDSMERLLGILGIFLILVVTRLAERGFTATPTATGRLTGFLARRAIAGIGAIGWLIDRLPFPAPHGTRGADRWPAVSGSASTI